MFNGGKVSYLLIEIPHCIFCCVPNSCKLQRILLTLTPYGVHFSLKKFLLWHYKTLYPLNISPCGLFEQKMIRYFMKKYVLFRISSKGYPKIKVNTLSKLDCLSNLMSIFRGWEFICVAYNCEEFLWRTSNSTAISFGLLGKTLIADGDIWPMTSYRKDNYDFEIFSKLTKQEFLLRKKYLYLLNKIKFFFKPERDLRVCVLGLSLHLEIGYLSSKNIEHFQLMI